MTDEQTTAEQSNYPVLHAWAEKVRAEQSNNPVLYAWAERMQAVQREAEAARAEQDAREHQEALDALTDPLGVLAQAYRAAQVEPDGAERAQALTAVAQAAATMLPMHPAPGDDFWADDDNDQGPDDGPHALACRFVAELVGESKARIGDREMLFVRYTGWVDLSQTVLHTDDGGLQCYRMTGRAVSRYNDRVLVVTDGGVGMVLPVGLVELEPDE